MQAFWYIAHYAVRRILWRHLIQNILKTAIINVSQICEINTTVVTVLIPISERNVCEILICHLYIVENVVIARIHLLRSVRTFPYLFSHS